MAPARRRRGDEPMTDQTTESTVTPGPNEPAGSTGSTEAPASPDPERKRGSEERMEGFGRKAEVAGERFGQRAQASGERWSRDPGVAGAADTAGRVWGLLMVLVGLWFFADVTLGLDMPSVPWRDVWPVGLIVVGLAVVLRGMGRRSA
jgi:hypothetical protein